MNLHITLAQINPTVGDWQGNARLILEAARAAHAQGAAVLLTPALALSGCGAQDLLWRRDFLAAGEQALAQLAQASADLAGLTLIVGHPAVAFGESSGELPFGQPRALCAATALHEGRVLGRASQRHWSAHYSRDERRWLAPGSGPCVITLPGTQQRLRLCVGDDVLHLADVDFADSPDLTLALCADPWRPGQGERQQAALGRAARASRRPLVCANLVGGQDERVFGGASLAVQADGTLAAQAPAFETALWPLQVQGRGGQAVIQSEGQKPGDAAIEADALGQLWAALVLAVRDYARKNGFARALLGLSGGIDSALVLALAVDALGADAVHTVMLPGPYTADISLQDAREMARRMGVRHDEIAIAPGFDALRQSLAPLMQGKPADTTEENLQARLRGVLLMALSNKHGHLLLTTGNKSEVAVGYCTLYGDTCGGFAPIKDIYKTTVFALARWRNAHNPYGTADAPMPERIITRPPSAELRADQTDQDSLPPYDTLDAMLERVIERGQGADELLQAGFASADVARVLRLLRQAEYKRRQLAPGPLLSARGMGAGHWSRPVTNGWREQDHQGGPR